MKIKDHGKWVVYTPRNPVFPDVLADIMYAKRESDGVDWYVYSDFGKKFDKSTVKVTCYPMDGQWIVGAATFDGTAIFPGGLMVLEVIGYKGGNPQSHFGGKIYDPYTKEFTARPDVSTD